jgi:hypothetical protein
LNYSIEPQSRNKFHTFWEENQWNTKYMWPNKNQEAIYNIDRNDFDYSPLNWATYNYGSNDLAHFIYDVIPYYILWNSPNDPTNFVDRVFRTFK